MREIEKKMVSAVNAGREWKNGNTRTKKLFNRWLYVYLHDNAIFCKDLQTGAVSYSCAGWHTVTTSSRLRALGCNCRILRGRLINCDTLQEIPSRLA